MSSAWLPDNSSQVPPGYAAIPISADQMRVPLRLCVLVRPEPDANAGHFVVLRDTVDARVLLGCITDATGAVHQWVALWMQSAPGDAAGPVADDLRPMLAMNAVA